MATSNLDPKSKRELLLKSHSLMQGMYDNLKQSGKKRMEMEIMLSRGNHWDMKDRTSEEYQKHKVQLTTGVSAVLKTISSKPEIPRPFKEKLSSIFLNPPTLQNANWESHIGPIGPEIEEHGNPEDVGASDEDKSQDGNREYEPQMFQSVSMADML